MQDAANASSRSQYAAVSFSLSDDFSPNPNTGLIPASSIRVGVGASATTAVWASPCEGGVAPDFAARLVQPRGPNVTVCTPSPAVSLTDRWARLRSRASYHT